MNKRTKKILPIDALVQRMGKYCSISERTLEEVKRKLKSLNATDADAKIVIERLTKQGFIDEKRFASTFTSGKFRVKKWGKTRIKNEMRRKGLPQELIEKGLKELPKEEYLDTLTDLLKKKWEQLQRKRPKRSEEEEYLSNKQKLMRYAVQKGYEYDIIIDKLRELSI